jgi:hypothetical protein
MPIRQACSTFGRFWDKFKDWVHCKLSLISIGGNPSYSYLQRLIFDMFITPLNSPVWYKLSWQEKTGIYKGTEMHRQFHHQWCHQIIWRLIEGTNPQVEIKRLERVGLWQSRQSVEQFNVLSEPRPGRKLWLRLRMQATGDISRRWTHFEIQAYCIVGAIILWRHRSTLNMPPMFLSACSKTSTR